jgi:3-deoxy-D-manno-octulosonic-acid transferase
MLPEPLAERPRVWFHALSVGEAVSVAPLLEAVARLQPQWAIVFTTATETGQQAARALYGRWVEKFLVLPHDIPWVVDRWLQRVRPTLGVLVETDLWPQLLCSLRQRRIPCVLVNARVSPRSFERLRRFRPLTRRLFAAFAAVFVQSPDDRARFLGLGCPRERLHAAGNLKFDQVLAPLPAPERERLRAGAGIDAARPVWIAGSTHGGEEEQILAVHRALGERHAELLLILAPRRVERAPEVAALCARAGLPVARRSLGEKAAGRGVYLLDTLGELARFYSLARAAFVGGSLVAFGGHNPLEALAQGTPAFWGPHLFNFRQVEAILLAAGCARRVTHRGEMEAVLADWLADEELASRTLEQAAELFATHRGATARIVAALAQVQPAAGPWPEQAVPPATAEGERHAAPLRPWTGLSTNG